MGSGESPKGCAGQKISEPVVAAPDDRVARGKPFWLARGGPVRKKYPSPSPCRSDRVGRGVAHFRHIRKEQRERRVLRDAVV